jgi:BirA family transcriptional regulator, biotin operon repressor / biotin---[acetyl-CoA-carboxylase] ligase
VRFEPSELEARFPGVVYCSETASTNRVARGRDAGTVVVADHQTAGRGRLGRTWVSEPGANLLLSVVMAAPADAAKAPRLCLLWAAAIAEAIDVRVKWPNDLVDVQGRKLGGLLAELDDGRIVLGIGLNANQLSFPGVDGATSLRELRGAPIDRLLLLEDVLRAVRSVDYGEDLSRWRSRNITLGRRVTIGGRTGVAEDVREDGALLVDGAPVLTGDVELLS